RALMLRARFTGGLDDYAEAEQVLARAFATAAADGPLLTRASLNFSLHRLTRMDADLARLGQLPLDRDRADVIGLAADLAFQRGQYDVALRGFQQALAQQESVASLARLATWH